MIWHVPGVLEREFFTDLRKSFHYHSKICRDLLKTKSLLVWWKKYLGTIEQQFNLITT